MALVRCPDCGRDVSSEAPACVGCGRPMRGEPPPVAVTPPDRSVSHLQSVLPVKQPQPPPLPQKRGVHPAVVLLVIFGVSAVGGMSVFLISYYTQRVNKMGPAEKPHAVEVPTHEHVGVDVRSLPTATPTPAPPTPIVVDVTTTTDEELAALRRDAAAQLDASGAEARKALAELLEAGMLSKGLDMRVEARGKGRKQLRITYLLANRPFVFQEMHDQGFIASIRTVGFESIYFSNGSDFAESYSLK